MILILSDDIRLYPGPVYNHHPANLKEWNTFKLKGLHLPHLNVNSLLMKTDELRYIANLSNAAVIGITESKLDDYILDSEIQIDNYQILHCDGKGKEWVAYVRNDLSYIETDFIPTEMENILFEILLPKTKPITVGIIYRPPNKSNFLQTLNENFGKLDILKKELYVLGDFNINLYQNLNHAGCTKVSNDVKNYL